jgi:hypothetical protein
MRTIQNTSTDHARLAQRAWGVLVVLCLGLFLVAVPARLDELAALEAEALARGLDVGFLADVGISPLAVLALELCFVGSFAITCAAILWGEPDDWRGYPALHPRPSESSAHREATFATADRPRMIR